MSEPETIIRIWKVKLKLRKEQQQALEVQLEIQRRLYNRALNQRDTAWIAEQKIIGIYEQKRDLITGARNDFERPDHPDMIGSAVGCSQQTLMRLDYSYRAFFKRLKEYRERQQLGRLRPHESPPGPPRFRRFGEFETLAFNSFGQGIRFDPQLETLTIMYVPGNVQLMRTQRHRQHYPLPAEAIIKMPRITRRPEGWYLDVVLELPPYPLPISPTSSQAIGLIVGIEPIIITNKGESLEAPRHFRNAEEQIAKAYQIVSRRKTKLRTDSQGEPLLSQRGRRLYEASKRRRKAVRLLARRHRRVANTRALWQRTVAKQLVERYGIIIHEVRYPSQCIGKPAPRSNPIDPTLFLPNGAAKIREVNKAILDNAWAQFFDFLNQAAQKRGSLIVKVAHFEPTQRCSRCGACEPDTTNVGDGIYRCKHCGLSLSAFINNATNILQDGLKSLHPGINSG